MFEDWKEAWREAVENFRRELSGDEPGDVRTRAMKREFDAASGVLDKLDGEIRRARREAAEERESEQTCRRREDMARRIGDDETVRIAVEFAVRHAERATVLERKVAVLEEERGLVARDVDGMKQILAEEGVQQGVSSGGRAETVRDVLGEREREDRDFSKLEREAREKAAEERLEELKRRMR